ncbi:MAG: response regulator transcription factor [Chitinophagales bacterium]|nr:response regulator transcription factor [Chitinophagales bacterium]
MKILIIEDEPAAAKRLHNLIESLDKEYEVIEITDSIEGSIKFFNSSEVQPDLIISDIHLADGSSFEIFKELKIEVPVVFVTAYDQYAIDAFKVNSIDYLLKPVKKSELEESINKFKKLSKMSSTPAVDLTALIAMINKDEHPKRLVVRYGQNLKAVNIVDVAFFHTENKIVFLTNFNGEKYAVDQTLEELESMIDHNIFFRINRQFIININAIEKMISFSKSRVKLILKPKVEFEVIVSVDRSPHFKKWLTGSMD